MGNWQDEAKKLQTAGGGRPSDRGYSPPQHQREPQRRHDSTPPLTRTDCTGQTYFENGHLKMSYVARRNVEPIVAKFATDYPALKRNQLNRFFRYCRLIQSRLDQDPATWEDERINVAKLSSFAADAFGKEPKKIPASFREFIDCNVDMIKNKEDFCGGFMEHFEAVMGFASLHLRD